MKITPAQLNALREIALHVSGDLWPSRTMVERLATKGLVEVEWRHTTTMGKFVQNATLTEAGRAVLPDEAPAARKLIKLQPGPHTDEITDGGIELTQLPYPFFVHPDSRVDDPSNFWRGDPANVVGFVKRLDDREISLYWDQILDDPQQVVGMYLVTRDSKGTWATHTTAISEVEEF